MCSIKVLSSFELSDKVAKAVFDFWSDKVKGNYVVSVKQSISNSFYLTVTVFKNKPYLYIGLYSMHEKAIVDLKIDDHLLCDAIRQLDVRYAMACTVDPPLVNYDLGKAWYDFIRNKSHTYSCDWLDDELSKLDMDFSPSLISEARASAPDAYKELSDEEFIKIMRPTLIKMRDTNFY